jgi:hypothetical protein
MTTVTATVYLSVFACGMISGSMRTEWRDAQA